MFVLRNMLYKQSLSPPLPFFPLFIAFIIASADRTIFHRIGALPFTVLHPPSPRSWHRFSSLSRVCHVIFLLFNLTCHVFTLLSSPVGSLPAPETQFQLIHTGHRRLLVSLLFRSTISLLWFHLNRFQASFLGFYWMSSYRTMTLTKYKTSLAIELCSKLPAIFWNRTNQTAKVSLAQTKIEETI